MLASPFLNNTIVGRIENIGPPRNNNLNNGLSMILLILTIVVMPTSSGNVASDGMIVFENINIIPADIPLNMIDVNIAYSFQLLVILEKAADVAVVAEPEHIVEENDDDESNSAVVVVAVLSVPPVADAPAIVVATSVEGIRRVEGTIGDIMEFASSSRRCYWRGKYDGVPVVRCRVCEPLGCSELIFDSCLIRD